MHLYYNNRTVRFSVCVTSTKRDTQATIALLARHIKRCKRKVLTFRRTNVLLQRSVEEC